MIINKTFELPSPYLSEHITEDTILSIYKLTNRGDNCNLGAQCTICEAKLKPEKQDLYEMDIEKNQGLISYLAVVLCKDCMTKLAERLYEGSSKL